VLGIMTWWHDDDWAGRIQQVMETGEGDRFEIIRYPAINDVGDEYLFNGEPGRPMRQIPPDVPVPDGGTLTRPHNTAIHPDRYTTEAMLRIKKNLYAAGQQRVWNALYQQNPAPEDGLFFTKDMFRYYSTLPHPSRCHIYQAWDFAITEGAENDYTVGATIYQDENDALYVADIRRFKSGDSFFIIDEILNYAQEWGATMLGFEDGQIWKALQALFDKRCIERRQYPSYEILKPLTDKMVRASPLRGRMQIGKVYFNDQASWFRELYHEMTRFPAGKHDDQIDALSWVTRLVLTQTAPREKDRTVRLPSWKDKLGSGARGDLGHMAA
jgi:predicted phage terminase large subunit-like protein